MASAPALPDADSSRAHAQSREQALERRLTAVQQEVQLLRDALVAVSEGDEEQRSQATALSVPSSAHGSTTFTREDALQIADQVRLLSESCVRLRLLSVPGVRA